MATGTVQRFDTPREQGSQRPVGSSVDVFLVQGALGRVDFQGEIHPQRKQPRSVRLA